VWVLDIGGCCKTQSQGYGSGALSLRAKNRSLTYKSPAAKGPRISKVPASSPLTHPTIARPGAPSGPAIGHDILLTFSRKLKSSAGKLT
jgi:hypothetical protein